MKQGKSYKSGAAGYLNQTHSNRKVGIIDTTSRGKNDKM